MLKRLFQSFIPPFLLNRYKENEYFKILRDFDVKDQPDLIIAEKLVDENSIFVDIGANIGLYTKYLSPFTKQVKAFEPVPFTFSMLSKNVTKFKLNNVELNQVAVSSKDGEATIEVPIQGGARNYYRATLEQRNSDSSFEMKIKVPIKTIDSLFLNRINEISFIKVDVEGHEISVLKGADNFLTASDCSWLIETDGNPDDEKSQAFEVFRKMEGAGFNGYFFDGKVLNKRREGDKSVNYFFLKRHHIDTLSVSGVTITS